MHEVCVVDGRADGRRPVSSGGFDWSSKSREFIRPDDQPLSQTDSIRAAEEIDTANLRQHLGSPKEEAAYQEFSKASEDAKKIKLGNAFLAKYPGDRYSEAVYEVLAQAYYNRKDLANFYTYSDKGLSLFPDDVHLLALTGWVIPRAFTPRRAGWG